MSSGKIRPRLALRTVVGLAQRRVAKDPQPLLDPEQWQAQNAVQQLTDAALPRGVVVLGLEEAVGERLVVRKPLPLPLTYAQDVAPVVEAATAVGGRDHE